MVRHVSSGTEITVTTDDPATQRSVEQVLTTAETPEIAQNALNFLQAADPDFDPNARIEVRTLTTTPES